VEACLGKKKILVMGLTLIDSLLCKKIGLYHDLH